MTWRELKQAIDDYYIDNPEDRDEKVIEVDTGYGYGAIVIKEDGEITISPSSYR